MSKTLRSPAERTLASSCYSSQNKSRCSIQSIEGKRFARIHCIHTLQGCFRRFHRSSSWRSLLFQLINRGSNIRVTAKTISTMASTIRIFIVSLSVPKIIGIGPIMISPPPLVFPLSETFLMKITRTAMKVTMNPKTMRASPKVANAE